MDGLERGSEISLRFTKPKKSIGIDVGTHSVKAVQMSRSGRRHRVEEIGYALVDRTQVNVDPVLAHADAVRQAIANMAVSQSLLVGALPGQTVVIRYPRIARMAESEIANAIEAEAGQNIPYDLNEVFLDWSVLEELSEGDQEQLKVLLVAAKHEVIESRVQIADAAEIQYGVLGVDSLALSDAAECCDLLQAGETVALVNIGASSASIHFMKDRVSNFIRDVSWGAREMIQAISKSRRCDYSAAEKALMEEADEAAPQPQQEAPQAVEQEQPQESSAGLLDPLEDELSGLDMPSQPPDEPAGLARDEDEESLYEVLSLPISRLVSEIRRSFDYYEHQLYEDPVDRMVVSGGVADMPILRQTLQEELGLDEVVVANPLDSALSVAKSAMGAAAKAQPAQFMVATGLAARGTAEL